MSCSGFESRLVHFQRGEIHPPERAEVGAHLEECASCRKALADFARIESLATALPRVEPSTRFADRMRDALPAVYATAPAVALPVRRPYPALAISLALHAAALIFLSVVLFGPERTSPTTQESETAAFQVLQENLSRLPRTDLEELVPLAPEEAGGDPHAPLELDLADIPPGAMGALPSEQREIGRRPWSLQNSSIRERLVSENAPWMAGRFHWRENSSEEATPERREAIESGLAWLASAQEVDGSWNPARHGGNPADRIGSTGLALLALLGAGHSPVGDDLYGDTIAAGIAYLESVRDPETGTIGPIDHAVAMDEHAIGTLALLEAAYLRGGPRAASRYRSSIDRIVEAQTPHGGWGYHPGPEAIVDPWVTTWQVQTLIAARSMEIDLPEAVLIEAARWIESSRTDASEPTDAQHDASALLGIELHASRLLGLEGPTLQHQRTRLLESDLPRGFTAVDLGALFHSASALFEATDPEWNGWEARLLAALLPRQISGGQEAGSWAPDARSGRHAGRVASTAWAVLTLEVPHRAVGLR